MKKILLVVLLIAGYLNSHAQSWHLKFENFGVSEGLPESQVQFIKQDSQGYIWMGTQNGLLCYDGYKPKVYHFGTVTDRLFRSMMEDHNKDLWFTTVGNGILKLNRLTETFTQYKYPEKNGKTDIIDPVFAAVDNENKLWFYCSSNANPDVNEAGKFDPETGKFQIFDKEQQGLNQLNATNVNHIFNSQDGIVWLGTNNGLYRYSTKYHHFYAYLTTTDTSRQKNVNFIYEASSAPGVLWINIVNFKKLKGGLERFDTRTQAVKDYYPDSSPGTTGFNNFINSIYEDKKHLLWLASANGLMSFDRKTEAFANYWPADNAQKGFKNFFLLIAPAKDDSFWLMGDRALLNFDPATHHFERYTPDPANPHSVSGSSISLLSPGVGNLCIDNSGILWVAFQGHGADRVDPLTSAFLTYNNNATDPESYPGGNVTKMIDAGNGYIWFTNGDAIYEWRPGSNVFRQVYKAPNGHVFINNLIRDTSGRIYFSSARGFNVYDTRTKKLLSFSTAANDPATLSSMSITTMLQDHTGKIWIGTDDNGICTFDPAGKKFTRYQAIANDGMMNSNGKLDDVSVQTICEDKKGTIWVGTNHGGLNCFDRATGKFRSFLFDGHRRVLCITKIFEDSRSRLWVGTYLDGLFEFDRKTGRYINSVNENNGLLFNGVPNIFEDSKGFLWVLTTRGLNRIDPTDLSAKAFPTNTILQGNRLNGSALVINKTIVMGLRNGVTVFNPDYLAGNPYSPQVNIERVTYSDPGSSTDTAITRKVYGLKNIVLNWNQNRVTFSYTALHFVDPLRNKYAYFLGGYDKQWINAGTQRSAVYTNLSPGTYTFRVKASNSDGVWNEKGDSFIIIIKSPWWVTWWAWTIYIVLFVAAVYAFIAYRSRSLIKEKHVLEESVKVRTKELSEANKELHEKKEEITSQRDQLSDAITNLKATQKQLIQSEKMASLGELTAGIAHEIQNPLNFVNNFSELSIELVSEMKEEINSGDINEVKFIASSIEQNLEKINLHGKRAGAIVKGMLEHSRTGKGQPEPADINALADEYLRLVYHGLLAKDKTFSAIVNTNFDDNIGQVTIITQDIGRVLINLLNNAFYAVAEKAKTAGSEYQPAVTLRTKRKDNAAIITVADNGGGIAENIIEKIFQPFFTTKPTGQGSTGLGLSLSYDIVKAHGGDIKVESEAGKETEFMITLPIN